MIASSLKEGEGLVDLLLSKDADVNIKSMSLPFSSLHKTYSEADYDQIQTLVDR